ncbi:MAG: xanthine dehydrogenase large subunit [Ignavibacteria bacterium]|nr:MAG: xanthine dehydrogenase large subunit [Ignavibacteria bacterium]KAF0159126.1 MAG: xanthine dehydrogenase large subunit [Ignavibacteria bacterium]
MKNYDSIRHARGESQFIDDLKTPEGTLVAYVYYSPVAHGKILELDFTKALKSKGVAGVFSAKDIPGDNQIGGIIPDENLFAEHEVHFIGHPIAVVAADTYLHAKEATKKITAIYEKLKPVLDAREAAAQNLLIIPPRKFELGNVEDAWQNCDYVVEGKVESGGQEHLYLETQGSLAIPTESGGVFISSATQGPTNVQKMAARVLALPMSKVEVDVQRLGGGFGGKEDQATPWACIAALAAYKLKKPVKLILNRQDDIRITGKRHPYSSDFKIGLNKQRKILAFEATYFQNAGATADLSPAILDRTLFHCTNSYYVPNVRATAISCKTNLPPFTAFRGFGGPQGIFVFESAIYKAAQVIGVDPVEIQKANLLKEGDEFSFGQKTYECQAENTFAQLDENFNINKIKKDVNAFNNSNKLVKKGVSVLPICFGISFTTTFLNQASALVHIYTDGSINISTAAVEMGQGVNAKLKRIAARTLNVYDRRINVESTNTSRVSNTSPTAASKGTDLNGFAVIAACEILIERLKKVAAEEIGKKDITKITFKDEIVFDEGKQTNFRFEDIVNKAYLKRISLTAQSYHATPEIHFDKKTNKGKPFSYHVYGACAAEVTVDCLRGTYKVDSMKVVHDTGESLHSVIDLGQIEGGIVQGIGWMTSEELIWNSDGRLITDALSTYKVPDIHAMPKEMNINFLDNSPNVFGPLLSKAVGEPPFLYGMAVYFALLNAMRAFKPNLEIKFDSPLTPEKVLLTLYDSSVVLD